MQKANPVANPIMELMDVSHNQFELEMEYQILLFEILLELQGTSNFFASFSEFEPKLAALLKCERIFIFKRGLKDHALRCDIRINHQPREIRLHLGTSSIAGFAALNQKAYRVKNVTHLSELAAIHKSLHHDPALESMLGISVRSLMAIPIIYETILVGVLQAVNHVDHQFDSLDLERGQAIVKMLAQYFHAELGMTASPYDQLVRQGVVTAEIVESVLAREAKSGASAAHLLMRQEGVPIHLIGESLENYYQVPFMCFDSNLEIPYHLVKKFNENYLKRQGWVPVEESDDSVTIVMQHPNDVARVIEIEQLFEGKSIQIRVGILEDIIKFLDYDEKTAARKNQNVQQIIEVAQQSTTEPTAPNPVAARSTPKEASEQRTRTIIDLVNQIILKAYQQGCSDIHIQPAKSPEQATIRYRIDGICRVVGRIPDQMIDHIIARIKIIANMDISEKRIPQDGKCLISFKNQALELRVATIPTSVSGRETVVMRLLSSAKPLPLSSLNLSNRNLKETRRLIQQPYGMFLVVGPTGSGKTTTLHSVLDQLNTDERIIWTAEDPVEITQPGLQQVQMNNKVGFNFATALRAFLRADPDVIMVGEMRDQETAQMGIEAALTGHLILSTLHTNSAPETVTRLLDLGVNPASCSDALLGVLAQRLVRTLCKECKIAASPTREELETLELLSEGNLYRAAGLEPPQLRLMKPVGCEACGGSGYRGRIGIHELLVNSHAMRSLIFHRAPVSEIRTLAIAEGMQTLLQDGLLKVVQGYTDLAQLRQVVGI